MALLCIILAFWSIYYLIEETETNKAEQTKQHRKKELEELKLLREEVAELKKRERTLLMRRRTLEKGELLMKEELLEEKEKYK